MLTPALCFELTCDAANSDEASLDAYVCMFDKPQPHGSQWSLPHQLLQVLVGMPQGVELSAGRVGPPAQGFLLLKRRAGGITQHNVKARACGGTLGLTG